MANPTVEKLKTLGIRHGEKAVVGIAGALCLAFLGMAFSAASPIETTPDAIKTAASSAQSRLSASVAPEVVEEALDTEGLKNVDIAALVKDESKQLRPENFILGQGFVKPEPGAGLIRETPELIAPRDLTAHANRGGVKVYAFDASGNYITDDGEETKKKGASKKANAAPGGFAGFGGFNQPQSKKKEDEAKKRQQQEDAQLKKGFAGQAKKAEGKADVGPDPNAPPPKEIVEGRNSVVVTGILDHKAIRENYAKALKLDLTQSHPNYLRAELHRQEMDQDGNWSRWELVDRTKLQGDDFVRNYPESLEELATTDSILDTLVDKVPFMSAGYWQGVHRIEFVPEEKQTIQRQPNNFGGMGMPGGGMSSGGEGLSSGGGMGMPGGRGMGMPGGGMSSGGEGFSGGYGSGFGGGFGGGGDSINFPTSQAAELMVRALDFTVVPNTTYRYKMRVVVKNPNFNKEPQTVASDVDTKAQELLGPFSEPTAELTVPAEITAYVNTKAPVAEGQDPRADKIEFNVAKWLKDDGQIVVKSITYAPGQIIGKPNESVRTPSDGEEVKMKPKDFSSHLLLVHTDGGPEPVTPLGLTGRDLDAPARALLLRADGSVTLRTSARDAADSERRAVAASYKMALEDSNKKRENTAGGMYGGEGGMEGYGSGGMGMTSGPGGGRRGGR